MRHAVCSARGVWRSYRTPNAVSDRSETAFGVLYDRHTPRALQTAWRILGGDAHAAEDVMQDAWVRAVATLDSWRDGEAFGAWLRGITVHVAIDALRRERR